MAAQKIKDKPLFPNSSRDGNGPDLNKDQDRPIPIKGGFGSGVLGSGQI